MLTQVYQFLRRRYCRRAFGLLCGLIVVSGRAQALQVNPARTELRLLPGATAALDVTATNDIQEPLQVEVSVKDWFVLPANKDLTVARWLHLHGESTFMLNPGDSRTIHVTVDCPEKTQGELVGMVSLAYMPQKGSMITQVISVSVYVESLGTQRAVGELTDLKADLWKGHFVMGAVLKAAGNVHLRPSGRMTVQDAKGRQVGEFTIEEGSPVYPDRQMGYMAKVPDSFTLDPGRYTLIAELSYKDLRWNGRRAFKIKRGGKIEMTSQAVFSEKNK